MTAVSKWQKLGGLMVLAVCGSGLLMLPQHAVAAVPAQVESAATSASAPLEVGVMGNFEGKSVANKQYGTLVLNHGKQIGWGWTATDDQRLGGKSKASVALVHPGADGSHGALKVSGELKAGFISPWAGAIWFPGSRPMQLADLSGVKTLSFQVRGKPGSYSVMLMAGSSHSMPHYATFEVSKNWTTVNIPLATSFPGADFQRVYFIAFSAGGFGKFQFDLDQVSLH